METDPLQSIEKVLKDTNSQAAKSNRQVFKKYPVIFSFLSLVGFLSLLYGFEKTLDNILFFKQNPWTVLLFGLLILLFTGTLYKWLQNKEIDFR